MGVACTEINVECKKGSIMQLQQNIKQISNNCIYRSGEIYKECSFVTLAEKQSKKKIGKQALNATENNITHPINVTKEESDIVVDNNVPEFIQYNPVADQLEHVDIIPKKNKIEQIKTKTIGTSLTSLKAPLNRKWGLWKKFGLPRMLCPCCCGGGQDGAGMELPYGAYYCQSAGAAASAGSYENIDLRTVSNIVFPSLNLDASLMSIFNVHKRMNPRETPKFYVNMLKMVLRNTYKNTFSTLKRKVWCGNKQIFKILQITHELIE